MKIRAIQYLKGKQGFKGQEIYYSCNEIEMSEYLLPTNKNLTIDEKRRLFGVRNMMTDIPSNFSRGEKETQCQCGQREDMEHIYECEIYNEEQVNLPYKKIYNGSINEQIAVFRQFELNLQKGQQLRTKIDLFFHTESSGPPLPMHDCNCNILYLESLLMHIFAHVQSGSPGP